jgi:tetratricopeptide (TPR) repeat protein
VNYYYDSGWYARDISTSSPEARLWFNRGLVWNYGYHHEEAIEIFAKAHEFDPESVILNVILKIRKSKTSILATMLSPMPCARFTRTIPMTWMSALCSPNRSWQLWELSTGKPAAGAGTEEAIASLETAFEKLADKGSNRHPGLLHMYLHLMEMSPHPEKALRAGDALFDLVPDAGHLQHMPTHIAALCGDYQNVVLRNH